MVPKRSKSCQSSNILLIIRASWRTAAQAICHIGVSKLLGEAPVHLWSAIQFDCELDDQSLRGKKREKNHIISYHIISYHIILLLLLVILHMLYNIASNNLPCIYPHISYEIPSLAFSTILCSMIFHQYPSIVRNSGPIPSDKRLHIYVKSPCCSWVNQQTQLPYFQQQTLSIS